MTDKAAGEAIRAFRASCDPKMSLDQLAERIKKVSRKRPSAAKLSRIETGIQPVPLDILDPLVRITGIPANKLRPDLAKVFEAAE